MRALRLKAKTQDDLIEAVKARLGGGVVMEAMVLRVSFMLCCYL